MALGAHEVDSCVVVRDGLKKSWLCFRKIEHGLTVRAAGMAEGWLAEGVRRNCRVQVGDDIFALLGSAVSSFASGRFRSHNTFQFFKKKVGGQATKPSLQPRLKTELFVVALRLTAPGVTGVFYALHSGTATPYDGLCDLHHISRILSQDSRRRPNRKIMLFSAQLFCEMLGAGVIVPF